MTKIIHSPELEQITFLDERFYLHKKSGEYFPSATTVLDVYPKGYGYHQWLKDLGSNADQVVQRAQEQGTKIHEAIEKFLKGEELVWTEQNYTLDEWMMLLRFHEFYTTYKPEPLGVEVSLVSPELGFGGTLDLVCKLPAFPNDIFYIDWKSGNGIYKSNKIQASAYQRLWNTINGPKGDIITRIGCMHLRAQTRGADKTGKQIQGEGWKLDEVENPDHEFKLFEHSLAIWKEENPNPKPKNIVYPDRIKI